METLVDASEVVVGGAEPVGVFGIVFAVDGGHESEQVAVFAVFVNRQGDETSDGVVKPLAVDDVQIFGGAGAELTVAIDVGEVVDYGVDVVGFDGVDMVCEVFVVEQAVGVLLQVFEVVFVNY